MAVQVWNPSTGRWEQDLSSPRLDSEFWASLDYMWPLLNKTKQFIFSKEGHTYNSRFLQRGKLRYRGGRNSWDSRPG